MIQDLEQDLLPGRYGFDQRHEPFHTLDRYVVDIQNHIVLFKAHGFQWSALVQGFNGHIPASRPYRRRSPSSRGRTTAPRRSSREAAIRRTASSRLPMVTVRSICLPSRCTVLPAASPTGVSPTRRCRSAASVILSPLNLTTRSPYFRPAVSTGLLGTTSAIRDPLDALRFMDLICSGVRSRTLTPNQPRTILPWSIKALAT